MAPRRGRPHAVGGRLCLVAALAVIRSCRISLLEYRVTRRIVFVWMKQSMSLGTRLILFLAAIQLLIGFFIDNYDTILSLFTQICT